MGYAQGPKGYQRQTQLTHAPAEPSLQPPPPAPPVQPDYSVSLYPGRYAPQPTVEPYSPSESDSTTTDDQLVPISSHLSPAYGSDDVFTPFFTTIFPQMSPHATLTEVTLNVEELNVRGDSPEDFPFAPRLLSDSSSPPAQSPVFSTDTPKPDPYQTFEVDKAQGRLRPINPDPTPAELQHYCMFDRPSAVAC